MGKKVGNNTIQVELLEDTQLWSLIDFVHEHGADQGMSLGYEAKDALHDIQRRMREYYYFDPVIYEKKDKGRWFYIFKISRVPKMRAYPIKPKFDRTLPHKCDLGDVDFVEIIRFTSSEPSNFAGVDRPNFVELYND